MTITSVKVNSFHPSRSKRELAALNLRHRAAFGAACCERLFPYYEAFEEEVRWGKGSQLRRILDRVWDYIEGADLTSDQLGDLLDGCEAAIPDADDFHTQRVGPAQNAACALYTLLQAIKDPGSESVASTATFAVNTVDTLVQDVEPGPMYLNSRERDIRERRVLEHPMMQQEISYQAEDLEKLRACAALSSGFLRDFRAAAKSRKWH